MEGPQPGLLLHHFDPIPPTRGTRQNASISTSPEHSRARSKKTRAADQNAVPNPRPQIRRRESSTDGTRRGRSCTRSVSPGSAERRALRGRRSRSPSRSCSTTASETQSPTGKRKRRSRADKLSEEVAAKDLPALVAREESRESPRSRSKRRQKYRRRSDHAAAAAEMGRDTYIGSLRSIKATRDTEWVERPPHGEAAHHRMESFESVLEEDEDGDGMDDEEEGVEKT